MFVITKRFTINDQQCEISLERVVWVFLMDACVRQNCRMTDLFERIDSQRGVEELSVAIRMFALLYAREQYHFDASGLVQLLLAQS